MKNIKIYCSKCGTRLIWKQDWAEKHTYFLVFQYVNFDKYDTDTGKRQVVGWWECPKYHWWNSHDSYQPKLV